MEAKEDELLTAKEVGKILRVTATYVRVLVRRGEFAPAVQFGRRSMRFSRRDVLAWIESRKSA